MVFWVFGYGSLVWNPGFEYDEKVIGFIKDYRRVFDLGKALLHMLVVFVFTILNLHSCHSCLELDMPFQFYFLQHALITEEHLKTLQELAHWRKKKGQFA